ncbi:Ubiquitin-conjugating enzyme E2 32 [Asimina triloba]
MFSHQKFHIRTALVALIAFMPTNPDGALGSLDYKKEERRALAIKSREAAPKFGTPERQKIIDEIQQCPPSKQACKFCKSKSDSVSNCLVASLLRAKEYSSLCATYRAQLERQTISSGFERQQQEQLHSLLLSSPPGCGFKTFARPLPSTHPESVSFELIWPSLASDGVCESHGANRSTHSVAAEWRRREDATEGSVDGEVKSLQRRRREISTAPEKNSTEKTCCCRVAEQHRFLQISA